MSSGSKRKAASMDSSSEASPEKDQQQRLGKLIPDLLRGLQNPALCDIELVASDGGRVPAIRSILATRSAVFERMFLGDFKEAGSDEVQLPYSTEVLQAVVEYCSSDEIARCKGLSQDDEIPEKDVTTVRVAVQTAAAAHYLELNGLHSWLKKILEESLAPYTCAVWDEALKHASLEEMKLAALGRIRQDPRLCLGPCEDSYKVAGVTMLSSDRLLSLVEDEELRFHALDLFRAIKKWSEAATSIEAEQRREIARTCASKIDLRLIPPKDIALLVRGSGLVDNEKMLEILAEQAKPKSRTIYVIGAGSSCVNGVYKESEDTLLGEPVYEKAGIFNGRGVKFAICTNGSWWFISAPPEGAERVSVTSDDIDFYVSDQPQLKSNLKWAPIFEPGEADRDPKLVGVSPAPKVFVSPSW